ncbi:MAG: hypothetical protein EF806_02660 [Candidatus Methanoliparum thermophilum]|uniref:ACT domain-containing protein n=1 Tax=Methanoliparum thermophilum TaxID=2491083 RepID=A0A520KSS8_METT2|nr:DUF5612 domain-containing protein [Candidatus Methanoliparum sp. LAM-1]RZN64962.1 MAG: hypothetical protein EF806_02660 [Candidatus Methanoliparum thermophilum]BDC36155.1 hypothetical protein MTLP_08370 [Candidatus Methanoliparum sp. LAM-1]
MDKFAIVLICNNVPGVLRDVSSLIADFGLNIMYTQQYIIDKGPNKGKASIHFEIEGEFEEKDALVSSLKKIKNVDYVGLYHTFKEIWGKRVIIIGGGAQVAQVAIGAINEADRHNIRGDRISIDTIPLVGEDTIADAVNAVSRTHRSSILVLAGSLMGGRITKEVEHLKEEEIPVISLNMAGSVPKVCDLVVTDPIQAGTFAVMHIADSAKFDINRVKGRKF